MASAVVGSSREIPIVIDDNDSDIIILDDTPPASQQQRGPVYNADAPHTFHEHSHPGVPILRDGDPGLRLLRRMENAPDIEVEYVQTPSVTVPSSSILKRKREELSAQQDDICQRRNPSPSTSLRGDGPETRELPAPATAATSIQQKAAKLSKKAKKEKRQAVETPAHTSHNNPQITPPEANTLPFSTSNLPLPQQILGWDAQYRTDVPGDVYAHDPIALLQQQQLLPPLPFPIPSQYHLGLLPSVPATLPPFPPLLPLPSLENGALNGSTSNKVNGSMKTFKSKAKLPIGVDPEIPMQGTYPLPRKMRPPDLRTSLVLDYMPKKLRKKEFILEWCSSCGCGIPRHAITNKASSKVFIEFATVDDARKAFNSPRLHGNDGRSGIRAWWYRRGEVVVQQDDVDVEDGEILESSGAITMTAQQQPANAPPAPAPANILAVPTFNDATICEAEDVGVSSRSVSSGKSPVDTRDDHHEEMEVSDDEGAPSSRLLDGGRIIAKTTTLIAATSLPTNATLGNPIVSKAGADANLEELRKRVLASKEANRLKNAPAPPKLSIPVSASSSTPNTSPSTTLAVQVPENLTPPSLTSGSSSSSMDEAQDFVSAFISDAIRSVTGPSLTVPEAKPLEPILDVAEETAKKQKCLEQHIAESKNLMEQYSAATSKAVREQLMKVIKAKNSLFDVENKAFDRRIEQAKAAAQQRQRRQHQLQLRTFRWPETTRDANILILSDDEDDDYMSEG